MWNGVLWVLRPPARVILHVIMLPVDLLFLLFDAFSVNIRKSGLFGLDCRGRDSYTGGICPPARKYTNKVMFRLICPEMGRSQRRTVCQAGEKPAIRFVRAIVMVSVLIVIGFTVAMVAQATWPRISGARGTAATVREIARARVANGDAAYEAGRYDTAASLYKSALRLEPASKELLYKIGLCFDELKQPDTAVGYFTAAAQGQNAHPPAARRMALYFYARGDVANAKKYAQQAIDLGVADGSMAAIVGDAALWDRDTKTAEPQVTAAEQASPESNVVKLVHAHLLMSTGQTDEAAKLLDSVLTDPSVALLAGLYKLDLLRQTGHADEALLNVRTLANRFPDLPRLSMLLVDTQLASGQRAEALKEVERLREHYRNNPGAKLDLAVTLSRRGQDSLALQIAQECATDAQYGASANVFMGQIFLRRGMPDYALAYAQKALGMQPNLPSGLLLAGRAALTAGDLDKAGVFLNGAIQQSPKDPAVWHTLGLLHLAVGDLQAAEDAMAKACELDPSNGQLHQDYGMVLFNAGQKDPTKMAKSKMELQKAADLLKNSMTAYTSLAMLARQSGDDKAAQDYYLHAIEAAPGEAAIAANNLAELLMANDKDGKNAPAALALAYSAYVRAAGTRYEKAIADTFRKALSASHVTAEALGVTLQPPRPAPSAPPAEIEAPASQASPPSTVGGGALAGSPEVRPGS